MAPKLILLLIPSQQIVANRHATVIAMVKRRGMVDLIARGIVLIIAPDIVTETATQIRIGVGVVVAEQA